MYITIHTTVLEGQVFIEYHYRLVALKFPRIEPVHLRMSGFFDSETYIYISDLVYMLVYFSKRIGDNGYDTLEVHYKMCLTITDDNQ